jgi:membrane protein implicated in regulation of membrane protease activity
MYNKETIRRYILFQIPEFFLTVIILFIIKYFYDYPLWILILVIVLSVIKDVFLFRFTWKSYVVHKKEDYAGVKGEHAIAQEDFSKTGLVKLNGELWKATVDSPVKKGEKLIIKDINGLVLIAEKIS